VFAGEHQPPWEWRSDKRYSNIEKKGNLKVRAIAVEDYTSTLPGCFAGFKEKVNSDLCLFCWQDRLRLLPSTEEH
jgi:transposase InsO family protein